jgi:putative selenate reductase molybdopterin-binding subunit
MKIELTVDGLQVKEAVKANETLLHFLRRLGLTQVKEGCGVGDCGSCAVLIDGVARNSCITFAEDVAGAQITTAKGMGNPTEPSTLQRAMAEEGGVQCGFCIPGFLASTQEVLNKNKRPSKKDFATALDGHFCRCTGYINQEKALERTVFESAPTCSCLCEQEQEKRKRDCKDGLSCVSHSVKKVDAFSHACGTSRFVEDVPQARDALVAKVLKSPLAHAKIKSINVERARSLPGVHCVLTYKDVPRIPYCTAGQGAPEPSPHDRFILDHKVRFVGDRVALVAAETEEQAEDALSAIEVEYEELEAILSPEDAMKEGAPVIHDEEEAYAILPILYKKEINRVSRAEVEVGSVEEALKEATHVVAGEYQSQIMHHAMVEPHVCLTFLDEHDRVVIRTATQVPFHARRLTAQALGMEIKKFRVVKPRVGGGFGGKQEVILEPLCALLTLKTRRPVLLRYSRAEEFSAGRTRHSQKVRVKIGANEKGELTAISMKVLENTGAYGGHAHTVLCNAGCKTLPLYRCPNISFEGDSVYTNLPVAGAFRGYGAPQAYFALESCMDELAHRLDICPVELRKKTTIRSGESSPIWEVLGEGKQGIKQVLGSCGLEECIENGARLIGWNKRSELTRTGRFRQGMGMSTHLEGSSVPEVDMASAAIKMNEDGSFNLAMGATDLGQGSDTVLAQVAAEILGVQIDDIIVRSSDTDLTPFDVGAYASSTTYLSGNAVKNAAQKVRRQILAVAARELGRPFELLELKDKKVISADGTELSLQRIGAISLYEDEQFQIASFGSAISHSSPPPFGAQYALVEVDVLTGFVKVLHYVATVDCGRAINPRLAKGQMHGAVAQGLGYALTEEMCFDDKGRLTNGNFSEYPVYRMIDMPRVSVVLVDTVEESGPFGAKSIGEVGLCGALPTIGNAIFDATGVRLLRAPFTPERVLAALGAAGVKA